MRIGVSAPYTLPPPTNPLTDNTSQRILAIMSDLGMPSTQRIEMGALGLRWSVSGTSALRWANPERRREVRGETP